MDALALLCTLHADGPATLKRLRSLGCGDLATLVDRGADALVDGLSIESAAARRLVREARLLQHRVGDEALDREEAPPRSLGVAVEVQPPAFTDLPPEGRQRSELDDVDRSLVSRIRAAPAPTDVPPLAEPESESTLRPGSAPVHAPVPTPEPEREPDPVSEVDSIATPIVSQDEPSVVGPDLSAGRVPGLDAELVDDLREVGITTLAQLSAADSLMLTRTLGVTFAQARRLRFLARREVASLPAVEESGTTSPGADTVPDDAVPDEAVPDEAVPNAGSEPVSDPGAPIEAPAVDELPRRDELEDEGLEPADVVDDPPKGPAPSADRPPFWEPRPFLADASDPSVEAQGVPVDPSEIEPRPRFGDRLARVAADRRDDVGSDAADDDESTSTEGTVLGWNFEIPRPSAESLPIADPTREEPRPSAPDTAGPFA